MVNSDFFENRKPWSERKHRLLGKYLRPFSAKVASTTSNREIFVIDGFAGAARYNDGSLGSPVLIAQFSDVCLGWRNPVVLKLINVEPDKKNEGIFQSLEDATKPWVERGTVINLRKDFRSALPEILRIIGSAPALFFLDPFGPTDAHFDDLRPILERGRGITELIINFDHDGLRRIVDAALSPRTDPKAAKTNTENISKIIGSADWMQKIRAGQTSSTSEMVLIWDYMTNISKYDYQVVAYPVRETLNTSPKYQFVYCTKHSHGLILMNDFVREEEDLLYGEHAAENFPLFSEETSFGKAEAERREILRKEIEEYLRDKKVVTRGWIREALITKEFGAFHAKDYNAVVKDLIAVGKLREANGKTRINDDDLLHVVN